MNDEDKPRGKFGGDREDRGGRFGDKGGVRSDNDDRPRGRFGGDRQRGGDDRGGRARFGDRGGDDQSSNLGGGVATETESWDDAAATPQASAAFPFSSLEGTSEEVAFVYGDQSRFYVHKKPENPEFTQLGETISTTYSEGRTKLDELRSDVLYQFQLPHLKVNECTDSVVILFLQNNSVKFADWHHSTKLNVFFSVLFFFNILVLFFMNSSF